MDPNHHIVLRNGQFDGTTRQQLDALLDNAAASGKIVVHFHGGLVDQQSALSTSTTLSQTIYDPAGAYPVYFIWESGWKEILEQNLPAIFSEKVFLQILLRVTQYAAGKVAKAAGEGAPPGAQAVPVATDVEVAGELLNPRDGHMPFAHLNPADVPPDTALTAAELQQFENAVMNDQVLRQEAAAIATSVVPREGEGAAPRAGRASVHTLMSPSVVAAMRAPEGEGGLVSFAVLRIARGCVNVLIQVIKRYATTRDHGFHRTIVEEILREFYLANVGVFLWDGMKHAIRNSFAGDPGHSGGAAFIEGLKRIWDANKRPKIFLVGHSAGSIYVANFLSEGAAKLPADFKFGIIFVNAAATFPPLADAIARNTGRIEGVRQFAMGTTREGMDPLVHSMPFLYPGDLLYLVSGILEYEPDAPLIGMQRFYSSAAPFTSDKYPDIPKVNAPNFLGSPHGLVWAQSTENGYQCDLRTHGDFAADPQTVAGMIRIIQNGY